MRTTYMVLFREQRLKLVQEENRVFTDWILIVPDEHWRIYRIDQSKVAIHNVNCYFHDFRYKEPLGRKEPLDYGVVCLNVVKDSFFSLNIIKHKTGIWNEYPFW